MNSAFEAPTFELRASQLLATYEGVPALRVPSLHAQGNVVCVIGHNGSGKSTLIKTILGLHLPKQGSIRASLHSSSREFTLIPEEHMAFSPENGAVFADISVESYIRLWCRSKLRQPKYYLREGRLYVDSLEIAHLLHKLGRELSKGERRRVQTAIGFMCDPQLFLFDEPFDGLDVLQANNFASLLKQQTSKRCFFISSHRMSLVERLADQVIVLADGQVIAIGAPAEASQKLCPKSFVLNLDNTAQSASAIVPHLEKMFYPCAVAHIGSQIIISGSEATEELIRLNCSALGLTISELTQEAPSLTDAMTYHLNCRQKRNQETALATTLGARSASQF